MPAIANVIQPRGGRGRTGPIRPRFIIPNERSQSASNRQKNERGPYLNAILNTINTALE
ncbi:uncharacterized protein LACBIDRAFT_298828 [Laccaria bicolor S238N-H82]|uniref:Predicted protein n=1 Tax=Laccaria bicolor (strain S238N-H82 / ATCC MYA-4686) TaxID=486041 RepID=B0E3I5_LACBS|nr:uncharacterized protein LACBIDRAFT_298828 [Laccaria bicolor S238N-H82]EDQ98594.1 predicted protein [Laccaria bicolor S238N-H82]|eukprot:XP_001890755.1 predicted protein [Laccaria bicolor S238N-H82]